MSRPWLGFSPRIEPGGLNAVVSARYSPMWTRVQRRDGCAILAKARATNRATEVSQDASERAPQIRPQGYASRWSRPNP